MNNFVKIIIPTLVFVLAMGCKKEKPTVPEEVNPCLYAQHTNGDFTIEERASPFGSKYTITDTIFNGKNVRFTALQDGAEYTWYIGTEVLHDQSFERYFGSSLSNTDIPITLVTRKTPNKLCFPDDDGYDSITKIMHVSHLPIWNEPDAIYGPIEGTFRVKSDHLPDSFDVHIDMTYYNSGDVTYFNITNYDGFGSSCMQQARPYASNYRQLFGFNGVSVTQCDYMTGNVHIRMDGIVEMDFSFGTNVQTSPDYIKRKYLGRRI